MSPSEDGVFNAIENDPRLKALLDLPKRVDALEKRIADLERSGATTPRGAVPCPACGRTMKLMDEIDHPVFGVTGLKQRIFLCEQDGKRVTRDFDPSKDG